MQNSSHVDLIAQSGNLPSPKGVALAIMELCRHEDVGIPDVVKLVQTDPALCARLLRVANSAANGHSRPIVSVSEAVMRLGLGTVRQLAMGFSLVDQHRSGACEGFDYGQFWSHSLLMAVAAYELGSYTRFGSADELFACGLLARVGRLALPTIYPQQYSAILEQRETAAGELELEREILHVDHNDLTAVILRDCGIPPSLVEPAYYHEIPGESGFSPGSRPYKLVHLLYHANRIAALGLAPESERFARTQQLTLLASRIGLDATEFGAIVDRSLQHWQDWARLLRVPAGELPPFASMATTQPPKPESSEPGAPLRVLLVDDNAITRKSLELLLQRMGNNDVHIAQNGEDALAKALDFMPQVVVTDWRMPVMDGIEFCKALRATEWGQSMYVIMLTGMEADEEIVTAFEAGVDDYVTKPVNARAMHARMRAALHYVKLLESWERDRAQLKQFAAELAISNRRLEHAALTDLLTGLPNRRAGLESLAKAWSGADRSGQPLSVMMIDIDNFKTINDRHGHAVGDIVLKEIARIMQTTSRKDDSACRLGGEEFLLVCHNTDLKAAIYSAARLLQAVRDKPIEVGDKQIPVTISIGIAGKEGAMEDADALVNTADKALYAAKNFGRDQACISINGQVHRTQHEKK